MKRLRYLSIGLAVIVASAATVAYAVVANRNEQVFLVNDGLMVLRVDGCDVDGLQIPPGVYATPIAVTDRLICPVYRNDDSAYLGCLVIKRERMDKRPIPILQSIKPGVALDECDPG